MYVTSSPQKISLLTALLGTGRSWSDLTPEDDSDASYRRAMEVLIAAGYVDAKVEATVTMQDRLGSIRLIYQCHGPCYDLVDEHARSQSRHNREWCDSEGWVRGTLTVTMRPLAVRLSAKSIDKLRLDRPDVKAKAVPMLVDKLVERMESDGVNWLTDEPEFALLDIGQTARTGPDSDNEGVFYWNGTGHKIRPLHWKLLRAIWGHDEVIIADAAELVWGDSLKPESTIRSEINRLNNQFIKLNIPLAWCIDAGQILPEH